MPIIKKRQNTIDLVAQYFGAVDSLFDMAQMNGISITENVVPGNTIEALTVNKQVVNYFIKNALDIASEPLPVLTGGINGGIGFMKITNPDLPQSNDFIVS